MSNGEDDATQHRTTVQAEASEAPSSSQSSQRSRAGDVPDVIKGRFVLEARIGDGGMGTVYRALDRNRKAHDDPQPYVALKILKGELLREHPDTVLALQREASRALRLSHHNIVRVYDFDVEGDIYFITMELLQGESLTGLLSKRPRGLPLNHVLLLLEQLCAGLSYAHDQGIVHSDLKPSNIFVTTDSVVKILDFGIAAPFRRLDAPPTRYDPRELGALTPSHAAPEQWERQAADPRDDVYALACIVYELLSGKHPFGGEKSMVAAQKQMKVPPIPSLSPEQNAVLCKALAFKREERTASVEQFYQELKQPPVAPAPPRERRTAPSGAVAAGVVAALAAAGAVWIVMERSASERASSAADSGVQAPLGTAVARPDSPGEPSAADTNVLATNASVSAGAVPTPATTEVDACASLQAGNLELAIDAGLAALSFLSFGDDSTLQEDCERVRSAQQCLLSLRQKGAASTQSRALLADLDAKIAATCK